VVPIPQRITKWPSHHILKRQSGSLIDSVRFLGDSVGLLSKYWDIFRPSAPGLPPPSPRLPSRERMSCLNGYSIELWSRVSDDWFLAEHNFCSFPILIVENPTPRNSEAEAWPCYLTQCVSISQCVNSSPPKQISYCERNALSILWNSVKTLITVSSWVVLY